MAIRTAFRTGFSRRVLIKPPPPKKRGSSGSRLSSPRPSPTPPAVAGPFAFPGSPDPDAATSRSKGARGVVGSNGTQP